MTGVLPNYLPKINLVNTNKGWYLKGTVSTNLQTSCYLISCRHVDFYVLVKLQIPVKLSKIQEIFYWLLKYRKYSINILGSIFLTYNVRSGRKILKSGLFGIDDFHIYHLSPHQKTVAWMFFFSGKQMLSFTNTAL